MSFILYVDYIDWNYRPTTLTYKIEEKLRLVVREQRRLNTAVFNTI
jgi:hypothetical protein